MQLTASIVGKFVEMIAKKKNNLATDLSSISEGNEVKAIPKNEKYNACS